MNVIPVINCPDAACVKKKIEVARTFLPSGAALHLDITDGVFSRHTTWHDAREWAAIAGHFTLEVHAMVERPEDYIEMWIGAGMHRYIVHVETVTEESLREIMRIAKNNEVEIMLSSVPATTEEMIAPYLRECSAFQVLAVEPGPAGQAFIPTVLPKISFLREHAPDATIEVDGGMTPESARLVKSAGADTIVSENYLFEHGDPKKAYEALLAI